MSYGNDDPKLPNSDADDLDINPEWQAAISAIENGESVFITGAAGTGKSTLLRYVRARMKAQHAVVAPTGVAALNVNGQTIHSFFHFPPCYISPDAISGSDDALFRELRTLIIDEISMVRADLLQGTHLYLQRSRRNAKPFGGVQIVMFGDPYQLAPVVDSDELHAFFLAEYGGPYFFHAPVFQQLKPRVITLEKNYRQKDEEFLRLLSKVRKGTITDADLALLNRRYVPISAFDESYVHLTSTKRAAESRNKSFLDRISAQKHTYHATIIDHFPDRDYPTDSVLELKAGAKIMMVMNDKGKRWVNGTIGKIAALVGDSVWVEINGKFHTADRETWDNYFYRYDSYEGRVVQDAVGSFVQVPVRLAWAMTIHKGQGQTLERAYLNLGRSAFASGQTYVGLSRCTTLEGIALWRPVRRDDIIVDPRISDFEKRFINIG
jgi:ATP-dependent exoDNAse (exonuclease V) alpha subunit